MAVAEISEENIVSANLEEWKEYARINSSKRVVHVSIPILSLFVCFN